MRCAGAFPYVSWLQEVVAGVYPPRQRRTKRQPPPPLRLGLSPTYRKSRRCARGSSGIASSLTAATAQQPALHRPYVARRCQEVSGGFITSPAEATAAAARALPQLGLFTAALGCSGAYGGAEDGREKPLSWASPLQWKAGQPQ
uniref:Uncharacterized protein n=1 Tax=Sphaerodactylus townsendi TaxID=933632 RepID=A0ACB8G9Y9_9SAUR